VSRARRTLNRCTHPAIQRRLLELVLRHLLRGVSVVVLDFPLLIESGLHRWVSEVVVVAWYGGRGRVGPHTYRVALKCTSQPT
jgi:dephospho-CoA kinase